MQIGYKIQKPVITQQQCDEYSQMAKWCNENNAHIEEYSTYYEVVENPPVEELPVDNTPTLEQRINDIELALMELAEVM